MLIFLFILFISWDLNSAPRDALRWSTLINAIPPAPDPLVQMAGGFSDPFNITPYPSKLLYNSPSDLRALGIGTKILGSLPRYRERIVSSQKNKCQVVTVKLA